MSAVEAPSAAWIRERLEGLRRDDPEAYAELASHYPEAIYALGAPWADLTAEQQAARRRLHDELVEATGW